MATQPYSNRNPPRTPSNNPSQTNRGGPNFDHTTPTKIKQMATKSRRPGFATRVLNLANDCSRCCRCGISLPPAIIEGLRILDGGSPNHIGRLQPGYAGCHDHVLGIQATPVRGSTSSTTIAGALPRR